LLQRNKQKEKKKSLHRQFWLACVAKSFYIFYYMTVVVEEALLFQSGGVLALKRRVL
jgi:hypothetical protein